MITGDLRNKIDKLWLEFWQGGITNPLTVIEQITFLMFARLLDINERRDEKRRARTGKPFRARFRADQQALRWSHFVHEGDPERLLALVRDQVFRHFREHTSDIRFGDYMKDARLVIEKPSLLVKAVRMIDELPLDAGDTKGDLYEYLLSKLTTAGINGQFRTPRHIIRLMVRMLDPKPDETVADPACGTAGFLVTAMEHLLETHSSAEGTLIDEGSSDAEGPGAKPQRSVTYTGDLLDQTQWQHIKTRMFHGFDFDSTMLRIAAMNLYMHGVEDPDIHYQDTLAQSFADRFPAKEHNAFDLILANPPFKGSLDQDTVHPPILRLVKTKKTELLFIVQILRMLKTGGRAAVIVPQGVLFGSSKAHQGLRRLLVDDNQLEAVVNLPSGVFKPYAGVATAILFFVKGGQTDQVWFYDVQDDGFSLDDKRDVLHRDADGRPLAFAGDMPKVLDAWLAREKPGSLERETGPTDYSGPAGSHAPAWEQGRTLRVPEPDSADGTAVARVSDKNETGLVQDLQDEDDGRSVNDRTQPCFWVSRDEIAGNKYDLSINRYKEVAYVEEEYDPPREILAKMRALEVEILKDMDELEGML